MTDEIEILSPREAYNIASQWGSYMRSGDPGAVFYSFSGADATPHGPEHRKQLLAYTEDCLNTVRANPNYSDAERPQLVAELEALKLFFEHMPDSGEDFRETYADESARLLAAGDDFFRAYVGAAVWTGVEYPDGHPGKDHDRNNDLAAEDVAPEALRKMAQDCAAFQKQAADLLAEAYDRDGYGNTQWSAPAQAGHDFWLTRNRHGAGFWDRGALEADGLGDKLSEVARTFGESDLYQGDDGGIYL